MKSRTITPSAFVQTKDMLYVVAGIDANTPDVKERLATILHLDPATVDSGFSIGFPQPQAQTVLRIVEVLAERDVNAEAEERERLIPGQAAKRAVDAVEQHYAKSRGPGKFAIKREPLPVPRRTNAAIASEKAAASNPVDLGSLLARSPRGEDRGPRA